MTEKVKKIVFVCTGNICRSPLAHALFAKKAVDDGFICEVESAGTHAYHLGEDADPRMRRYALACGYPFSHPVRHFTAPDIAYYDYIFAMDRGHYEAIQRLAGDSLNGKLYMFREFDSQGSTADDVPDPYYGGDEGFETVFTIVDRTTTAILEAFKQARL